MAFLSEHVLSRDLNDAEEREFREYAEKNDPERLSSWACYHPVSRRAWLKRGITPPPGTDLMDQPVEGFGKEVPMWVFGFVMQTRGKNPDGTEREEVETENAEASA